MAAQNLKKKTVFCVASSEDNGVHSLIEGEQFRFMMCWLYRSDFAT